MTRFFHEHNNGRGTRSMSRRALAEHRVLKQQFGLVKALYGLLRHFAESCYEVEANSWPQIAAPCARSRSLAESGMELKAKFIHKLGRLIKSYEKMLSMERLFQKESDTLYDRPVDSSLRIAARKVDSLYSNVTDGFVKLSSVTQQVTDDFDMLYKLMGEFLEAAHNAISVAQASGVAREEVEKMILAIQRIEQVLYEANNHGTGDAGSVPNTMPVAPIQPIMSASPTTTAASANISSVANNLSDSQFTSYLF